VIIYLDESGDLGFSPGASDYFVISFLTTKDKTPLKRAVRKVKKKHRLAPSFELKGNTTPPKIKEDLLKRIASLDINIYAIVMNKANVSPRLRQDTNILYNYVLGLIVVPYICKQTIVTIVVDRRVVSVTSGFKLDEYLAYKVWYENLAEVDMQIQHEDSKWTLSLQAADVVCNSIFRKYESGDERLYNLICGKIKEEQQLFF
jgi:hypothetical protein